ncbi:MAG: tetratricopeptide repeat protein [Kiritimatiellae bacterium]|nr:tetratricopeptide repeat protein [Kiritimatiellia bacterium]
MNSSHAYALSAAAAVLVLAGCGPKDGARELGEGRAAFELGDNKKAERLLEKSLSMSPGNVDALVSLARVKLALGEIPAAGECIGKAAERAAGDVDVRLVQAQVAWFAKDFDAAAKTFAGLANDAALAPDIRAQGWTGLGVVEMSREKPDIARTCFLRAIRIDRRCAAAWYHLGLLYRDAFGYPEAALEQFEIFVRLEESASPRVQKVQRSVIPAIKETVARTTASLPGVSGRDSAASSAEMSKAIAALKKKDYRTARSRYEAALKSDPLNYPAALGLAQAWQRTDLTKAGQTKALEAYRRACVLRPGAVKEAFLPAGALAARLGMHAQAVEIYSRAVAASPASFDALDGLVRALGKVGGRAKDAQAYQDYRKSITVRRKQ